MALKRNVKTNFLKGRRAEEDRFKMGFQTK